MANQLENLLRLNRTPEMPRGSNRLAGVVEPAMAVGSNILAEIPAYAAGMTELNQTGLPSEGFSRLEEVSEMLTYNPRTMEGQAGLQSLTNGMIKVMDTLGVDEAINYLNNTIVPNLQKTFGEKGAREIGSSVMMSLPFVRKVPGIKAFHGSPHDFDEFSMDQIGTGEGAQAYGHGLYFAEAEDVARGYKSQLSNSLRDSNGNVVPINEMDTFEVLARNELISKGNHADAIESLNKKRDAGLSDDLFGGQAQDVLQKWQSKGLVPEGRMYEVDIDAAPNELLDWDLPLSEQAVFPKETTSVKAARYKEEGLRPTPSDMMQARFEANSGQSGEGFYEGLLRGNKTQAEASALLQEAGIKGIRYKDGFSRGDWNVSSPETTVSGKWMVKNTDKPLSKGEFFDSELEALEALKVKKKGSSNYVIFDDRLISIAKKYGIAIPAAAALLSQETGLNPSSLYEEDNPV